MMKHINVADLLIWEVPFPTTKNEQSAIAQVLFSECGCLIDRLKISADGLSILPWHSYRSARQTGRLSVVVPIALLTGLEPD